jgi:hypothetical protein
MTLHGDIGFATFACETMKAGLILAAASLLLALACLTCGAGNIWASSFKDAHFAE